MTKKEFAPVTPGEMLKEKFLAEYRLSQNQLAKSDWHLAKPHYRDHQQSSTHHGRHCAQAQPVLW